MGHLSPTNKYNRSRFLAIFENKSDNVRELDLGSSDFNRYFKIKYPTTTYTITPIDDGRPDLISLRIYGTVDYWWILMKHNGISDIFTELKDVNLIIEAPDVRDINNYILNVNATNR